MDRIEKPLVIAGTNLLVGELLRPCTCLNLLDRAQGLGETLTVDKINQIGNEPVEAAASDVLTVSTGPGINKHEINEREINLLLGILLFVR